MRILIAGDFCPQHRVANLFEEGDFSSVLGEVKSITEQADYSIVNYECPVCCGNEAPILKQGPNLKSSKSGIEAIKWAGFDCVTLANNHFRDYGHEGCFYTLNELENHGIDYVGGGKDLKEASNTRYKKVGDKVLAIINCCEHEFSIATSNTAGSNPLNPIQQYYAIQEATQNADFVIVIVHGGTEWYNIPTPRMKETYQFFIDAGANAVINHHQHCYSGYEIYRGKPIFYGLGNFCFDKGKRLRTFWHEGYMVTLDVEDDRIDFELTPYIQCAEMPTVNILDNRKDFDENVKTLNEVIADDKALQQSFHDMAMKRKGLIKLLLSPYSSRIMKGLQFRGMLPSFVNRKRMTSCLAHTQCEAHHDILIEYLKSELK